MTDKRTYDVVLFGATGFTGKLVAQYLASHADAAVRWAIAGRNMDKLQALKAELESAHPALAQREVGILQANNRDWASLVFMAQKTKVVLTTVGPYADGGDKLVHACIAGGADYVDITGEPEFVGDIMNRFDAEARAKGVRIVNCCGFDSIPHDLGVLFTVNRLPAGKAVEVDGFVSVKGRFSGGTWRTMVTAMSRMRETQEKAKAMLRGAPEGRRVRGKKPSIGYRREVKGWVFPLETIDPIMVLRSARALERYGPDFRYAHHGVARSLSTVAKGAAGLGAMFAMAQWGPTRNYLLDRYQSGDGPSAERRAKSWFRVTFIGKADGSRVVTQVSGGDPGYGETAKMVAESALCLALDRERLPEAAGILTPAVAMGEVLIERLERAGIKFEVLEQS